MLESRKYSQDKPNSRVQKQQTAKATKKRKATEKRFVTEGETETRDGSRCHLSWSVTEFIL
jgi:hypothetical protein